MRINPFAPPLRNDVEGPRPRRPLPRPPSLPREERALPFCAAMAGLCIGFGPQLLGVGLGLTATVAMLSVLVAVMLLAALQVVRHAEHLAQRLGEPFGTLILTLSVASIEVCSISAVMLHEGNNPTLVRDSLLSVVMVVLNGMVGLSLLIGAWRHREQHYNLQGANAYLGVIIPLVVLSLVLPSYTRSSEGATLSFIQGGFLAVMSLGLYAAFLVVQTGRHRGYFVHDGVPEPPRRERNPNQSVAQHVVLLITYMVTVVIMAEHMAPPMDRLVDRFHVPAAIGGLVMALLVATPEALGAVRAAAENHLQRAVNIFLGSVLATIGLTIPAMIVIGDLTGRAIELGVHGTDLVMLLLTLTVSVVTFASGRTNVLQGAVHLLLFGAYLLLMVAS